MSGQQLTAPSRAEFKTLKDCRNLGEAFQSAELMERIKASAPSHVKPQRMLRTFVQATSKAPLLLQCSMRSVLGAMLTCSEVGLEPNTPLQHAFLIPFGKYKWNKQKRERELIGYEVQLIFGYPGLLDLSYRSGQVTSVHADVAYRDEYDNGRFKFEYGTNAVLSHRPERARPDEEMPMFAYAHASLRSGQAFHVMPWADVLKIRNGSQGFRSALAAKEAAEKNGWKLPGTWTEAPWVKYERKMGGKTVFRSLAAWLPKSVELAGVLALDESQDRGTIDFGSVIDGDASIADGGYQENGPLVEDETDTTATFGLRSVANDPETPPGEEVKPEPVVVKPPRAAVTKPKTDVPPPAAASPPPPEPPEPSQPEVQIGQPPAFSAWLVDPDGSPIEGDGFTGERYTDPVEYARAFMRALSSCFPGDVELIRQANIEDAQAAGRISHEAMLIMAPRPPIQEPPTDERLPPEPEPEPESQPDAAEADPLQLAPPATTNKAGWDAWNERFGQVLVTVATPDEFNRLIELNEPIYRDFPPKYRLAAKTLLEAKQQALTKKPMPTPQEIHDGLMRDIAACKTAVALAALEKNQSVVRHLATLKIAAPELCEAVQKAARARFKTLDTAPPAQPPADGG
jgi:recombination protein RecT